MTNDTSSKNLYNLNLPEDLKTMSKTELETLATEIRSELIKIGESCGGHLASNLGVVEITIALHTVFNSPKDKMIWDTSHQTYVHKMLTGRLNQIYSIRQDGGLSGFAKIAESPHDTFGAGHASTSLSAALGVAHARDLKDENYNVIAIAGDSAFSGGMMFEALNNIENLNPDSNIICILNDNNMSISPPVGNMSTYITQIRTSKLYNSSKKKIERILDNIPAVGKPLKKYIDKTLLRFKDIVLDVKMGVIFEEFGFKYLGPIDGHNIVQVMAALKYAKTYKGPIMIHTITTKGKGHQPAEENPVKYHGVSPKPVPKPTPEPEQAAKKPSYTEVFGKKVTELAHKHKDMLVITPAMQGGSGLNDYAQTHPNQFIDVGIAEEHAVTFAAGCARAGVKPVLAIYSTFLQRGYDQLVHDVCLQNLPVIFALDRAGIVGQDGPTHHGVFDYNYELPIPNLTICAPKDGWELEAMLEWSLTQNRPISIRYPRGPIPEESGTSTNPIELGKSEVLFQTKSSQLDLVIISAGSLSWPSVKAAQELAETGTNVAVINLRFIKPLDQELLDTYIGQAEQILVVEEGMQIGSIKHYIMDQITVSKRLDQWHHIAIPDEFVTHGMPATLAKKYKFDVEGIKTKAKHITTQALRV